MINWNAFLGILTAFPMRGARGRYMNGLIHGGVSIALLWVAAAAVA